MNTTLPSLNQNDWNLTRDTIHTYAKIIGKIRRQYMPKHKHWWHITLSVTARGLTTTPFPIMGQSLELTLDLSKHQLMIESSDGWSAGLPLSGQSATGICRQIADNIPSAGNELESELLVDFSSDEIMQYDTDAVDNFHKVISWVDITFKTFKGGLREETGPVQIFPHHMDISMNWFSGNLVPNVDPADEESAEEQMNFGFVTGDKAIPDAYFYVTAYPVPNEWAELQLPDGAYWQTEGWVGAVFPYAAVMATSNPSAILLDYLTNLQTHGAKLMG